MRSYAIPIVLAAWVSMVACDAGIPFNRIGWDYRTEAGNYTRRHWMIDDLLDKHHFVGMPQIEVVELLGRCDYFEGNEMTYVLSVVDDGSDPIEGQNLVLFLDEDSAIVSLYIQRWKR